MEKQLEAIKKLRNETKVLIFELYEAANDKETFESILEPIKQIPPEPKEINTENKSFKTPFDYHVKRRSDKPLEKHQKRVIPVTFQLIYRN